MDKNIYIPARVRLEADQTPETQDAILEKVNRHTIEPLKREEIFTFAGVCSNDGVDSYMTRMDPATTLVNYERALKEGTPLIERHDTSLDPYGRSFDGSLTASASETSSNEVRGEWYIVRDLEVNNKNTNHMIRSIKAGIVRDMSVGFGGSKTWYRCSSCGNDIMDYDNCSHFPGSPDENGRMVYAWIVDGELREVSTVYKGAAPGAYIDKAREYAAQGQLSQTRSATIEKTYGIELAENKRLFIPKGGKQTMNILEQIRAAIAAGTLKNEELIKEAEAGGEVYRNAEDAALRAELGDAATVDAVKKLKVEAEQGRAYMTDLVDRAVAARVKVEGEEFNKDSYKRVLENSQDAEYVRSEAESFEKLAKKKFGEGGRVTEPETFTLPANEPQQQNRSAQEDDNLFA